MQFLLPFLNFTSQCILYIIPSINTLCSQKSMCNLYLALHIQVSSILSFKRSTGGVKGIKSHNNLQKRILSIINQFSLSQNTR